MITDAVRYTFVSHLQIIAGGLVVLFVFGGFVFFCLFFLFIFFFRKETNYYCFQIPVLKDQLFLKDGFTTSCFQNGLSNS